MKKIKTAAKTAKAIKTVYFLRQSFVFLLPFAMLFLTVAELYVPLIPVACLSAAVVLGIFDIRLSLFMPVVNRLKIDERKVLLTFDDVPAARTRHILAILERENIRALFFAVGKDAAKHPDTVRTIAERGHALGIHTQNHSLGFPFYGLSKAGKEIDDCRHVLETIAGRKITLFRPPFGVTNPVIARLAAERNLTTVGWTIRSLDTRIRNPKRLTARIVGRLSPGAVILLHDLPATSDALENLIAEIRGRGYGFAEFREKTCNFVPHQ
ncbi:MAG: polysaccharide deacetylase family protein [Prevotellaceae bacterium]|jgi:peptidoglycan/xylan/chitin deacetylase (PgdA/CDA1 family)|nr:polysaccharide deacetylase family protein [Prevotellaceae bacterium]